MEQPNQNPNYFLPLSIIIASIVIAGAIISSGDRSTPSSSQQVRTPEAQSPLSSSTPESESPNPDKVKQISAQDHILGNPTAPVKVIEFSDTECPFCKRFHSTMQQLIDEYGKTGQVAWVYRHFPLDQIHPKAKIEAHATECANELGGNQKFWAYVDRLFEITPSNNNLDLAELPRIAEYVGLDRAKFETCMSSLKYAQHIQEDLDDAIQSGGTGTPYSIIIAPNGQKFPVQGAQPYSAVKQIVDTLK